MTKYVNYWEKFMMKLNEQSKSPGAANKRRDKKEAVDINQLPISNAAKRQLPSFKEMLGGPDSLQCLVVVAKNIQKMINQKNCIELLHRLEPYQNLISDLVAKNNEFSKEFPLLVHDHSKQYHTYALGIMGKYPMYAGLAFIPNSGAKVVLKIQEIMLLGFIKNKDYNLGITKPDIYSLNLCIRKLTDTSEGLLWLLNTDHHSINSPVNLRDSFKSLIKTIDDPTSDLSKQLLISHQFLDILCEDSVTRRKSPSLIKRITSRRKSLGIRGISKFNSYETCTTVVLGDSDDSSEHPYVYSISKDIADKDLLEDLALAGIEPDEIDSPDEWIYSLLPAAPTREQIIKDKMRAKGTVNAIEAQNQFMPMSTQSLTDEDIWKLFQLINNNTASAHHLILLGMFATSSHEDRMKGLTIIKDSDRDSVAFSEGVLAYDVVSSSWLIGSLDLNFKTPLIDEAESYCVVTDSPYMELPDLLGFGQKLHELYGDEVPSRPFNRMKNLPSALRKLIKASGSRLTLSRIQRYLTLLCANKYGSTTASLKFSNHLSTASAKKHYEALSLKKAAQIHKQLIEEIGIFTGVQYSHDEKYELLGSVGARYLPETLYVSHVLMSLCLKIEAIRQNKKGDWKRLLHNEFLTLVIYLQGLLTGIRAIRQPLLKTSDFTFDKKIAVFRDKDSEDQFHTRNIPCHELVYKISEEYEKHRKIIIELLPEKSKLSLSKYHAFYINPDWSIEEARPKSISRYLKEHSPIPLNSNRKLLYNYLKACGCSTHAIDTQLGHASRAENYWERYKSRPLESIYNELMPHINQLIKDLDIHLVRGLLR